MCTLILLLAFANALSATDLKITRVFRMDSGGMLGVTEQTHTEYAHGAMRRQEFRGFVGESPRTPHQPEPRMAVINNCDTRETITLDLDAQEYRTEQLPKYPAKEELLARAAEAKAHPPANRPKPNLLIEQNTVDTGETAEFFGHTARHYMTTIKRTPLGDETPTTINTGEQTLDAWYIDLDVPSSNCMPSYFDRRGAYGVSFLVGGIDVYPEIKHSGPVPQGIPVKMKTTDKSQVRDRDGNLVEHVSTYENQVTELSKEPLDPALFQVPPGFKQVDHLYRH